MGKSKELPSHDSGHIPNVYQPFCITIPNRPWMNSKIIKPGWLNFWLSSYSFGNIETSVVLSEKRLTWRDITGGRHGYLIKIIMTRSYLSDAPLTTSRLAVNMQKVDCFSTDECHFYMEMQAKMKSTYNRGPSCIHVRGWQTQVRTYFGRGRQTFKQDTPISWSICLFFLFQCVFFAWK